MGEGWCITKRPTAIQMRKPVPTRVRELFVHARQHEMARIGLFRIQFVEALLKRNGCFLLLRLGMTGLVPWYRW